MSRFLKGLKDGYRNRRNRRTPEVLVPEILIPAPGEYRIESSFTLGDKPEVIHHQAEDRLAALAEVFEDVGDYSAAAVARDWAQRAGRREDPLGQQMAWAVVVGVAPDGS